MGCFLCQAKLFLIIAKIIPEQRAVDFSNNWLDFFELQQRTADNVGDTANDGNNTELREGTEEGIVSSAQRQ